MMKQIKFRAWDYENKVMYDPENIGIKPLTDRTSELTISSGGIFIRTNNERFELMQFTGLFDINSKEIYEGDIIESEKNCIWKQGKKIDLVIFKNGAFRMKRTEVELSIVCSSFKPIVIGNKFENSELMKKTKSDLP